jgi:lipopolysaccharide transport system permease protein
MTTATAKPFLTIRPPSGWAALNLPELWRFRDLLFVLAGRDLRLRYRQTALGISWVLIQPLLAAGVFAVIFGKVAKLPSDGVPYFIFSFAGLLGWTIFNGTVAKAAASLVGNAALVSKVYFPRLILPLSTVLSTLVDFVVALVAMIIFMLIWHVAPGRQIALLPLWVLLTALLAMGLGLLAAALTVSYRDVQYIIPVLLQLALYASPVAYSLAAVPATLRPWFALNPLAGLLEAFRWSLLGTSSLNLPAVAYSATCAVAAFLVGAVCFKRMERRFADVI